MLKQHTSESSLNWHGLTWIGGTFESDTGGTFHSDMPGTFQSAADGTFVSAIDGTFQSDMSGTFGPLLSSIADCSVWLYAKHNGYTLLTGDAKLRSSAQKSGVTVCGILGLFVRIFDMLVEDFKIIPPEVGAERLELLNKINNRLPSREIETRIKKWRFF